MRSTAAKVGFVTKLMLVLLHILGKKAYWCIPADYLLHPIL